MKNTKALKKLAILIIAIMAVGMLITPQTYAASNLQSNPTTGSALQVKTAQDWAKLIRAMEQGYYGSGEQIEELNDDLTPKTSNNIDVHFMKNTEYGAIAILSASEYGVGKVTTAKKGDNSGSTTGNRTGIIIDTKVWEATASSSSDPFYLVGTNRGGWGTPAAERYYDKYTTSNESAKRGDVLIECMNWYSSDTFQWPTVSNNCFKRGYNGIFNYTNYSYYNYNNDGANSGDNNCGRGVAVCGEGF
ncbi:MAG: hypothetical protein IJ223_01880 [Clostridia bacterium]|nr:hypothetical protein [Clostridia bacterium]